MRTSAVLLAKRAFVRCPLRLASFYSAVLAISREDSDTKGLRFSQGGSESSPRQGWGEEGLPTLAGCQGSVGAGSSRGSHQQAEGSAQGVPQRKWAETSKELLRTAWGEQGQRRRDPQTVPRAVCLCPFDLPWLRKRGTLEALLRSCYPEAAEMVVETLVCNIGVDQRRQTTRALGTAVHYEG